MIRMRKMISLALIGVAVAGLLYTLKLDDSTPQVVIDGDTAPTAQEKEAWQSADFVSISYTMDNRGLHFAINEQGQWSWMDDIDFPLDATFVEQLAKDLTALTPQQTIPIEEGKTLEDYDMDDPWCTIQAIRPDETTLELVFGKATTDGKARYASKDGDANTVYIYDAAWMEALHAPIYDMMKLPTLETLSSETIESVSIQGAVSTDVSLVKKEEGKFVWKQVDESAEIAVPNLLESLTQLSIEGCFNFKPTTGATTICGFDAPVATISVTHTGNSTPFVFEFGTIAVDEQYRYMRLEGDSTIYLVNASHVTTLIDIAKNGVA